MKKIIMGLAAVVAFAFSANAQTQKDWYMIGGEIGNLAFKSQEKNNTFSFTLTPKVLWFMKDNFGVGAKINLGAGFTKSSNSFNYALMPMARYYFKGNGLEVVNKTRWFGEVGVGLQGEIGKNKINNQTISTNGLAFDFGPGLAYFINQNVSIEALLKYNLIPTSFNGSNLNSISLGVGMQIYLPKAKLKAMKQDIK